MKILIASTISTKRRLEIFSKSLLIIILILLTSCSQPKSDTSTDITVVSSKTQSFFLDILQYVGCTVHDSPDLPYGNPKLISDESGAVWVIYNQLISFVPGAAVKDQELVFWNRQEKYSKKLDASQIGKSITLTASNGANNIWVSYENGHLAIFGNNSPFQETTLTNPDFKKSDEIIEMATDAEDQLAVLYKSNQHNSSVKLALGKDGIWTNVPISEKMHPLTIAFDYEKQLFMASVYKNMFLSLSSWRNDHWVELATTEMKTIPNKLLIDSRNRVWLGTNEGVYRLSKSEDSATPWYLEQQTDIRGQTIKLIQHSDTAWQAIESGIVIDTGDYPTFWGIPGVSDMAFDKDETFYVIFTPNLTKSQLLVCPKGSGPNQ